LKPVEKPKPFSNMDINSECFKPKKSIVSVHGVEFEHYPNAFPKKKLLYLRKETKRTLKQAKKVIVPTNAAKDDLVKIYNADPDKITVIPTNPIIPKNTPIADNKNLPRSKSFLVILSSFLYFNKILFF